jgi:hypothetical protein
MTPERISEWRVQHGGRYLSEGVQLGSMSALWCFPGFAASSKRLEVPHIKMRLLGMELR